MDQLPTDVVVPGADFFIRRYYASTSYRGPKVQQRGPIVEEGTGSEKYPGLLMSDVAALEQLFKSSKDQFTL